MGRATKMLVVAIAVLALVAGCGGGGSGESGGGGQSGGGQLTLGIAAGWTENVAITNLSKVILEDELGYEEVEVPTAELGVVFQGVGSGDLDAFQDMWLPNHSELLAEVEDDVAQLDPWYTGDSKFGIVAPSYMDITSIDQLNEAGATDIVGIDPGAVIMTAIEENTIPEYGLEQELIQSSEAAMLTEVEGRYEAEEPFAFIAWTPHWMNEAYDFTYLEDPQGTLTNPAGEPLDQAELGSITRADLEQDDPVAFAFLDAIALSEEEANTLENAINEGDPDDPTVGARAWMEDNGDVVQPWIDAAKQAQGG